MKLVRFLLPAELEMLGAANIDYKYIQRIEGKNPPALKIDTIERLSKALKVQPSKLLEF